MFPNLGLVGEFSQTALDDLRVFGLAWEIMRWDFPVVISYLDQLVLATDQDRLFRINILMIEYPILKLAASLPLKNEG